MIGTATTALAWRNITHRRRTTLVSVAAIAFAVMVMFMQLGFLHGLYDSQTGLVRAVRADLVMVSSAQQMLVIHETFPRVRLEQAAAVPGVKRVVPLYTEDLASLLKHPASGVENAIRVIGFDLDEPVFESPALNAQLPALRTPRTVLADPRSRPQFGALHPGVETELAGRRVTVTGTFELGSDYYYDGNLLASSDTFFELFPQRHPDRATVGLIQLEAHANAGDVLATLRERLRDGDVKVMTRDEIVEMESQAWARATPAGYVFTLGVAVGFVIGVIIGYQILYTDVVDHLPQIATLKALGYRDGALLHLVVTQSLILGLLGFVPALLMSFGLYAALTEMTGIVTNVTWPRAALVFGLTIAMCLVAATLAVRKALAADPAELF